MNLLEHQDLPEVDISDTEYVQRFIPLVHFLGEVLGKTSEVVLHDVGQLDSSVIAIANRELSGREIGAPATDLVLKILAEEGAGSEDYIAGYRASADGGRHFFRSATYFIRRHQRVVGMLCINTDDSLLEQVVSLAKQISENHLPAISGEFSEYPWAENLVHSTQEIATEATMKEIKKRGVSLADFTAVDRQEVVTALERDGIFRLKGAVQDVADALETSVPTVYRCLRSARRS